MSVKAETKLTQKLDNILYSSLRNDKRISPRVDRNIHVSDLPKFCARCFVLNDFSVKRRFLLPRNNKLNYTNLVGHLYHTLGRNLLKKNLVGDWECINCGKIYTFALKPEACKECLCTMFSYNEHRLNLKVTSDINLIGSVDAIVDIHGKYYIVEMKSMKLEYFNKLSNANAANVRQLTDYLWMVSRLKHKYRKLQYDKGFILYLPKQTPSKNTPLFKSYEIEPSEITFKLNNKIIKEIKTAEKKEQLPRKVCAGRMTVLAKHCNKVTKCLEIAQEEAKYE